jgi:hypothetical protein
MESRILTYSQSGRPNFPGEYFWIAISRKGRSAMSNCLEYIWLHQRYSQALRDWLRATNSLATANGNAAEQERDATFRALSDHKERCERCSSQVRRTSTGPVLRDP